MFDTLYIGTSGLVGYSKGLRVVSNNLSNVNTPGFKGSQLQFADFMYQGGASHGTGSGSSGQNYGASFGTGLTTLDTEVSFRGGQLQTTGNSLDIAVDGSGFFVLREDKNSQLKYTRAGSFALNEDNKLVTRSGGMFVQGFDKSGNYGDIDLSGLLADPLKATTSVKVTGSLKNDTAPQIIPSNGFNVVDANGTVHNLKLKLTKTGVPTADTWTVTLMDGDTEKASGVLQFENGVVTANTAKITLPYTPTGGSQTMLEFDFSKDVTYVTSSTGTTAMSCTADGYTNGRLTQDGITIDSEGSVQLAYTNGQKRAGPALALAIARQEADWVQLGGNLFAMEAGKDPIIGRAKTQGFGGMKAGSIEGSNVDLAQEFSNLIVMQRGYQASSRVVSTANEMIQELFDMKGRN